jgi:hypothetical protein
MGVIDFGTIALFKLSSILKLSIENKTNKEIDVQIDKIKLNDVPCKVTTPIDIKKYTVKADDTNYFKYVFSKQKDIIKEGDNILVFDLKIKTDKGTEKTKDIVLKITVPEKITLSVPSSAKS